MSIKPPSTISFSVGNPPGEDDGSELTGSEDGERSRTCTYFDPDVLRSLNAKRAKNNRELVDLKRRLARQQKKLDLLASKYGQAKNEIRVLKAENEVLVNELAMANQERCPDPIKRGWFFNRANHVGSMQMLIDTNSKLMAENARLQVLVDVTRKSFQSFIRSSRRSSDEDGPTKQRPQGRRLSVPDDFQRSSKSMDSPFNKDPKLSESFFTAKTSSQSSWNDMSNEGLRASSSQRSLQDSLRRDSLHSIPESELRSNRPEDDMGDDEWIAQFCKTEKLSHAELGTAGANTDPKQEAGGQAPPADGEDPQGKRRSRASDLLEMYRGLLDGGPDGPAVVNAAADDFLDGAVDSPRIRSGLPRSRSEEPLAGDNVLDRAVNARTPRLWSEELLVDFDEAAPMRRRTTVNCVGGGRLCTSLTEGGLGGLLVDFGGGRASWWPRGETRKWSIFKL